MAVCAPVSRYGSSTKLVLTGVHEPTAGNKGIDICNVIVRTIYPWGTPVIKLQPNLVKIVIGGKSAYTSRSAMEPTPGVVDGYVGFGVIPVPFTCVKVNQQQA